MALPLNRKLVFNPIQYGMRCFAVLLLLVATPGHAQDLKLEGYSQFPQIRIKLEKPHASFSPDEKFIVITSIDKRTVTVIDLKAKAVIWYGDPLNSVDKKYLPEESAHQVSPLLRLAKKIDGPRIAIATAFGSFGDYNYETDEFVYGGSD